MASRYSRRKGTKRGLTNFIPGYIYVGCTTTLQAIAYQTNWKDSSIAAATYVMSAGTVAAPTFSVAGGTYITSQTVTLSTSTSGATIRYTLDGSTPSPTNGTIGKRDQEAVKKSTARLEKLETWWKPGDMETW